MKRLIVIRGGGELAAGAALYLYNAGFRVLMLEKPQPTSTRREVSFADAAFDGKKTVARVTCHRAESLDDAKKRLKDGELVMLIDPKGACIKKLEPKILLDAIMSGDGRMTKDMAEHTIALGPGFCAGRDVDAVIETMRGHNLGRIIYEGYSARHEAHNNGQVDTNAEHIIFSPTAGVFEALHHISYPAKQGDEIAVIHQNDGSEVRVTAQIDGVIRGIVHDDIVVRQGQKIVDINPKLRQGDCFTISDKTRCIAGSVLAAISVWLRKKGKGGFLAKFNRDLFG